MKDGLFKDIVNSFVSIAKGLKVTLYNWSFLRPSVTEQYPEERPELPERYRGMPTLPVDSETGKSKCIACGMCARICPQGIITVVMDKSDPKDRKPASFTIDLTTCMFCGLCSEICPQNCLIPAKLFELACRERESMVYELDDLLRLGGIMPAQSDTEEPKE